MSSYTDYDYLAEIESLKTTIQTLQTGNIHLVDDLQRAKREIARSQRLVEALRKIADPRLRDHQEPDKYTECGCMMHMAEEALAEYGNANKDN